MIEEYAGSVPAAEALASGKAPNPSVNATISAALTMQAYFRLLIMGVAGGTLGNILINTTVSGPYSAAYIPVQNVTPPLPNDTELYLHLRVGSKSQPELLWHVQSWIAAVAARGLEQATRDYLSMLDPNFSYLNVPVVMGGINSMLNAAYLMSGPVASSTSRPSGIFGGK